MSYQWLLGGSPVAGATGMTYDPTAYGTYSVQVTDSAGCVYISDTLFVSITSLQNANSLAGTISVFPVPAADVLNVVTPNAGTVRVLNAQGQVLSITESSGHVALSVREFAAGVYLVQFTGQSGNMVSKRWLKQ